MPTPVLSVRIYLTTFRSPLSLSSLLFPLAISLQFAGGSPPYYSPILFFFFLLHSSLSHLLVVFLYLYLTSSSSLSIYVYLRHLSSKKNLFLSQYSPLKAAASFLKVLSLLILVSSLVISLLSVWILIIKFLFSPALFLATSLATSLITLSPILTVVLYSPISTFPCLKIYNIQSLI